MNRSATYCVHKVLRRIELLLDRIIYKQNECDKRFLVFALVKINGCQRERNRANEMMIEQNDRIAANSIEF